ncbi:MAG: 3-deoxy-8-phosphooctulonate synthase [Candidatus Omnitrophica bacterium]|nr:3-deoxy-8-phosphooctulonate synthase [Candidatus Omnitrophota bacterium]
MTNEIQVGKIKIGGKNPLVLIAGPCVIESEESALRHAKLLKDVASKLKMPLIYKSSYDKANRTSIKSYRGPGLKKGLAILKKVKEKFGIPVLSDVHCKAEIREAAKVLDVIQIPAFLSRQTDLILAAAQAGRVVNIKKGQFLAPWDMRHVISKIESKHNRKIILTERGVSFGYNNLVSDFRSILVMKEFGYPVVYDATHSVQTPAGRGDSSGGERKFIPYLSMAAVACGADGIFMEVHEDPERALSDGPNMVRMRDLGKILSCVKRVEEAVKRCPER